MQTRRGFLRTTSLGIAGLGLGACASEPEPEKLSNDLANLVNNIGIEAIKRKNFADLARKRNTTVPTSPYIYGMDYVSHDWRELALEALLAEIRQSPQLEDALQVRIVNGFKMDSHSDLRDMRREYVKQMQKDSPLTIMEFDVKDGEKFANPGYAQWGGRFRADKLILTVRDGTSYKDHKYQDQWIFYAKNRITDNERDTVDDSFSRRSAVTFISKKENIQKMQKAYGISEEEATKRLNEWLPKVLNIAQKLYIPPAYLPDENWVPNRQHFRKSPAEYIYAKIPSKR